MAAMGEPVPYPDPRCPGTAAASEHAVLDRFTVAIVCLGAVSLGPYWNHANLAAPYWRLYLNRQDGAGLRVGDRRLPLRAGRLYLIPAEVSYATQPAEGVDHIFVHFDLPGLPTALVRAVFPAPIALNNESARTARLSAIGDNLAGGMVPDLALLLRSRTVVDDCLAEVVGALPPDQRLRLSVGALHGGRLGQVLARIEVDPCAPHDLASLACAAGISPDHLARLFRRHLGTTPARHIGDRRLALAARALAYGEDDIETVAHAHGFANRFGFTRAFSRRFGCGPAAWRNRGGA